MEIRDDDKAVVVQTANRARSDIGTGDDNNEHNEENNETYASDSSSTITV